MIVFDSHTHVHTLEGHPWDSPPERLLKLMDKAGIGVSLIMPYSEIAQAEDPVMIQMRVACERYQDRLFYMARMMPGENAEALLRDELERPQCLGLKLHPVGYRLPPTHPWVLNLVRKAGELGCPTMFHCGDEEYSLPLQLAKVAQECPDSKIILGHMGGYFHVQDAIAAAREFPNLYLESSACPHPRAIEEAVEKLGHERVLFGSDGPGCLPALELEKILMLKLPKEQEEAVLYKNYLSLLPAKKADLLRSALEKQDLKSRGPFIEKPPELDFRFHVTTDIQKLDQAVERESKSRNLIPAYSRECYESLHKQLAEYSEQGNDYFSVRLSLDEAKSGVLKSSLLTHPNCLSLYLHPFEDGFRLTEPGLLQIVQNDRTDKPVMVAGGYPLFSQAEQCEHFARQIYPRKLIVSSAGQIDICGAHLEAAYQMMENCENVIAETSGIYRQDFIEKLILDFSPERVVYGSGAPFFDSSFECLRYRFLELEQAQEISSLNRWLSR